MREEQDLARAAALEAGDHDPADLRRGVEQLHRVLSGVDYFDVPAQSGETFAEQGGDAVEAFLVAAPRLDADQLLQGLDGRGLLAVDGAVQGLERLAGGARRQRGAADEKRRHS